MRGLRCSINSELRKSVCICNFGFAGGLVISAGLCYEALLVCVHIFSPKQEVTGEVPKITIMQRAWDLR